MASPHVVIIGGGFGGLYAAKTLSRSAAKVTLIDKRNFHLFQPLLYQVATGGLSPGEVASPLRGIFSHRKNVCVLQEEVTDIFPDEKRIVTNIQSIAYDFLIIATGVSHDYFGKPEWGTIAPGLKTIEDALSIRSRILESFEKAELEGDPAKQQAWMTFVIVGGGPTGVELAGALAELAHHTLKDDFRNVDPAKAEVLLIEGADRILPTFAADLSEKATTSLQKLGVKVRAKTRVTNITNEGAFIGSEKIPARTILWAAGVKASRLGEILKTRAGAELDRIGRVIVNPDLTVNNHKDIFVIGDLAHAVDESGNMLPGVAPVAMQQGRYVARFILGKENGKFHYFDKGSLAVIGRNAAVAQTGRLHISGFLAWLAWIFIHIYYLIEFDNKLLVMLQWAMNYFTRKRGARLITD